MKNKSVGIVVVCMLLISATITSVAVTANINSKRVKSGIDISVDDNIFTKSRDDVELYTVTDLGEYELSSGYYLKKIKINDAGQVIYTTGYSLNDRRPIVYEDCTMTFLDMPSGYEYYGYVSDINEAGTIVGTCYNINYQPMGVKWTKQDGDWEIIQTYYYYSLKCINDVDGMVMASDYCSLHIGATSFALTVPEDYYYPNVYALNNHNIPVGNAEYHP